MKRNCMLNLRWRLPYSPGDNQKFSEIAMTPSIRDIWGGVKRDKRIDSVKFWLIVLVIMGHVLMANGFSNIEACDVLKKWIYMFHMPLFVFLSGYFSKKKDKSLFIAGMWKIVEPLLLIQVIIIMSQLIIKGSVSWTTVLTPWFALWYLLSLFYWRLLLQVIPNKILEKTKLILFCSLFVSIISGFLPFDRLLSIQRTLSFMPFFFLGYCLKDRNIFLFDNYKLLCFVILLATFAIPYFSPSCLGSLVHARPYENWIGALQRLFVFAISVPMSLSFMTICINTPWIAKQGKYTMQYYIYHALTIYPLLLLFWKIGFKPSLLVAFSATFVITIVIGSALYLPLFRMLTNPSTLLKR